MSTETQLLGSGGIAYVAVLIISYFRDKWLLKREIKEGRGYIPGRKSDHVS